LDVELLAAIEAARVPLHQDRSTFIRVAIIEALKARGLDVEDEKAYAPDRAFVPVKARPNAWLPGVIEAAKGGNLPSPTDIIHVTDEELEEEMRREERSKAQSPRPIAGKVAPKPGAAAGQAPRRGGPK
jgi:hypothetical protein